MGDGCAEEIKLDFYQREYTINLKFYVLGPSAQNGGVPSAVSAPCRVSPPFPKSINRLIDANNQRTCGADEPPGWRLMLYKYLSSGRWQVLEQCKILFSAPSSLNDPFEVLPGTSFIETPDFKEAMKNQARQDFQFRWALLDARSGQQTQWDERKFCRWFDSAFGSTKENLRQEAVNIVGPVRDILRILCFSKVSPWSPEAILLWAHYTEGHKGFVVELSEDHPWIRSHFENRAISECGEVEYKNARPDVEFFPNKIGTGGYSKSLFRKSAHWAY